MGRLGTLNRFNHTNLMTVVTPTDRPESVRNRCLIEVLVAFLCCPLVFQIFVGIRFYVIALSQISFLLFLSIYIHFFIKKMFFCLTSS